MTPANKAALDALNKVRNCIPEDYIPNQLDEWVETIRAFITTLAANPGDDEWQIHFNSDGEFGQITGWLYNANKETGTKRVWRPIAELFDRYKHKGVLPTLAPRQVDVEALKKECVRHTADETHIRIISNVIDYLAQRGLIGNAPKIEGLDEAIGKSKFGHIAGINRTHPCLTCENERQVELILKAARAYAGLSKGV